MLFLREERVFVCARVCGLALGAPSDGWLHGTGRSGHMPSAPPSAGCSATSPPPRTFLDKYRR